MGRVKARVVDFFKTWHIRYDWSFAPFVVVVGGRYFLPVPECLLFDQVLHRRWGKLGLAVI
jgi:hypothetical protein